jgi:hypothetical protein
VPKAKVQVCIDAIVDVKEQVKAGRKLIDPCKSFAYRVGRVTECVEKCHGGDIDAFLTANPGVTGRISKFKTCANDIGHGTSFDTSSL